MAAQGSVMITTRCGPIEYQEAAAGTPLLMVHGSGGGHDQGMAFAGNLAQQGVRVIAMSRFGYLRTPMPADESPAAQADAHVCLLNALGIARAAVMTALAPTLALSTASQIKGAKFVGFEQGGHVWVGHQDEVMTEVENLLNRVGL